MLNGCKGHGQSESRMLINQAENTLDEHDFRAFVKEKVEKKAEVLIREKQMSIVKERLRELRNEKQVCEMMLNSLQEIPSQK